jgi:hypothetical protein
MYYLGNSLPSEEKTLACTKNTLESSATNSYKFSKQLPRLRSCSPIILYDVWFNLAFKHENPMEVVWYLIRHRYVSRTALLKGNIALALEIIAYLQTERLTHITQIQMTDMKNSKYMTWHNSHKDNRNCTCIFSPVPTHLDLGMPTAGISHLNLEFCFINALTSSFVMMRLTWRWNELQHR